MDKQMLEVILKKSARDKSIKRVLDIECEPALAKGENYNSDISRVKVKVVLGNERVVMRSFILKKGKEGDFADKFEGETNQWEQESKMYLVIFKEMEMLIEEFEVTSEPLWCNIIEYNKKGRYLLMEDLKAQGFSMIKRQIGLDLEHSLHALNSLGRFHAMAKVLEDRGLISRNEYLPYAWLFENMYTDKCVYGGMRCFAREIKQNWGPEWEIIANKLLETPLNVFMEKLVKAGKLGDKDFTCLNHGDCWSNNIMFKHDWQDRPISLRFLDFQVTHYNTPCVDVTYFMHTSIIPHVRKLNYNKLLRCYHESLTSNLERFGYNKEKPSFEDIESVMERLSFYAFIVITFSFPVITSESKEAFDYEKAYKSEGEFSDGFNEEIYKEDILKQRLSEDLKFLVMKHF